MKCHHIFMGIGVIIASILDLRILLADDMREFLSWCQDYKDGVSLPQRKRITISATLDSLTKDVTDFEFPSGVPLDSDGRIRCDAVNPLLQKMRALSAYLSNKLPSGLSEAEIKLWLKWNYGSRLDLRSKEITDLEPIQLLDIDNLDVSHNSLESLDIRNNSSLRFVKSLRATNNKLTTLDRVQGLNNLVNLVFLDLTSNELSDEGLGADQEGLFALFNQASQLTFSAVNLSHNKIRNLNGMENFRFVHADLASNLLGSYGNEHTIDDQIKYIGVDIKMLDLSGNNIKSIPSSFKFRDQLFYLNMDNNHALADVKNIPHKSLQYLSLNNTSVRTLDNIIPKSVKLDFLFLANTKVNQDTFAQLAPQQAQRLSVLSLSHSETTNLGFLQNFTQLDFLDLRILPPATDLDPLCQLNGHPRLYIGGNGATTCPCNRPCDYQQIDGPPAPLWLNN